MLKARNFNKNAFLQNCFPRIKTFGSEQLFQMRALTGRFLSFHNNFDSFKSILNYGLIESSIQKKHVLYRNHPIDCREIHLSGFYKLRIFNESHV